MSIRSSENGNGRRGTWEIKTVPNINILKRLATLIINEVKNIEEEDNIPLGKGFKLDEYVQKFEINIIRYALEITNDNQAAAAKLLGVKTSTLNSKIKRFKIYCTSSRKIPRPTRKTSSVGKERKVKKQRQRRTSHTVSSPVAAIVAAADEKYGKNFI